MLVSVCMKIKSVKLAVKSGTLLILEGRQLTNLRRAQGAKDERTATRVLQNPMGSKNENEQIQSR